MLKQLKSDAATLDNETIFCKSAGKEKHLDKSITQEPERFRCLERHKRQSNVLATKT